MLMCQHMKKFRVLIVDDNPRMCGELADCFTADGRFELVGVASDGLGGMEYFRNNTPPDVALVDMLMPVCDGAEMLYRLKKEGLSEKTVFVGISALCTDESLRMGQAVGFSYFIALPADPEIICRRVAELMLLDGTDDNAAGKEAAEPTPRMRNRDEIISKYLWTMGISAHHDGYTYMKASVGVILDHPGKSIGVTTDVYPAVAKMYKKTPKIVERSIRYAIDSAWLRGDIDAQHRLFGYTVDQGKGRPTNKECITLIAERTRMRLRMLDSKF